MKYGSFEINGTTIEGPKEYMETRFDEFDHEVRTGRNESYIAVSYCNQGTQQELYMRALQLDYAGWHGVQQIISACKFETAEPAIDLSEPDLPRIQVTRALSDGSRPTVDGWELPAFTGFEDFRFALVATDCWWFVIELTTGLSVASSSANYQSAITKAEELINAKGADALARVINAKAA